MARHELILPDLGLDEQPIVAGLWLVGRDSRVAAGDQLLEIVAGSAVVDLASPADGVLVNVFVDENDVLLPGQLLAVIESDGGAEDGHRRQASR